MSILNELTHPTIVALAEAVSKACTAPALVSMEDDKVIVLVESGSDRSKGFGLIQTYFPIDDPSPEGSGSTWVGTVMLPLGIGERPVDIRVFQNENSCVAYALSPTKDELTTERVEFSWEHIALNEKLKAQMALQAKGFWLDGSEWVNDMDGVWVAHFTQDDNAAMAAKHRDEKYKADLSGANTEGNGE